MGLDGPVLIRAECYRPPGRPSPLLPGHPLPSPAQETGFSANQCHGIKSGVKSSLVYGAWLGGRDGRVPVGPGPGIWLRLHPSQLSWVTTLWNLPVSSRMIHRAGHLAD